MSQKYERHVRRRIYTVVRDIVDTILIRVDGHTTDRIEAVQIKGGRVKAKSKQSRALQYK